MSQRMNQKMSQTIKALILVIPLTLSLSGCIIAVTDGEEGVKWGHSSSSSEWKKVQQSNKDNISNLDVGTKLTDVKATFGTPNFNEAFTENNKQYQVLFYRTRHKHSDGETSKDECTPLIFVDGVLTSWGEKAYTKL